MTLPLLPSPLPFQCPDFCTEMLAALGTKALPLTA